MTSSDRSSKAWGGRFQQATDPRVERFTESIRFDRRLFRQDIRASIAHARMLASVGLISSDECGAIVQGLEEIGREIAEGRFRFEMALEDIHMHVESALIARLGEVGRKLHTGRSRNDQVATDTKLWVREAIDELDAALADLQRAYVACGRRHADLIVPGYTHLQRAQPVLFAHALLAYVEKFARDRQRLADCRGRLNLLPLGAAALAGTSLPIDPQQVADELGFDGLAANSLDVSSDRDYLIEAVGALSLIGLHLSGWAEEWILWSTQEFGFLELPDAICTGSSIMPQKKNPDVLELIRGRAARVVGDLTTLQVLVKGLPLAYNRDLQEDKEPLFDAFETVLNNVRLATIVVEGVRARPERIARDLELGFLDATVLMEALIQRGVAQRTAHELIGRLVAACEQRGLARLAELSADQRGEIAPELADPRLDNVLGTTQAVQALRSPGSSAPTRVAEQLARWTQQLGLDRPHDPSTATETS